MQMKGNRLLRNVSSEVYKKVEGAVAKSLSRTCLRPFDSNEGIVWILDCQNFRPPIKMDVSISRLYCLLFEGEVHITFTFFIPADTFEKMYSGVKKVLEIESVLKDLGACEQKTDFGVTFFDWKIEVPYDDVERVIDQVVLVTRSA